MKRIFSKLFKLKYLILGVIVILIIPFIIIRGVIRDHMLRNNYKIIKAVVIDEKNYFGNDNVEFEYTFYYEFVLNRNVYRNDSRIKNLVVGDSILIKYAPEYPNFNKSIKLEND